MIKASTLTFCDDSGKGIIHFEIKKVSSERFNSMSSKDRELALLYIQQCEQSLAKFKQQLTAITGTELEMKGK